jgi:hypothetical protein
VKYRRTWVRYSVMRPSDTEVLVPSTSSLLMLRIVLAASRSASRAASPQDRSDTPSSSMVLMTGMCSPLSASPSGTLRIMCERDHHRVS